MKKEGWIVIVFILIVGIILVSAEALENNLGFEDGNLSLWSVGWKNVGRNYASIVTDDWSSEGQYSLEIAGDYGGLGIYKNHEAWAVHNFTQFDENDMVCIDLKKNNSDSILFSAHLSTGRTILQRIPSGEYFDLCTVSDSKANLGFMFKGLAESCPRGDSCLARIFIDNIRIYSCNDSVKNGDETDIDCGGRCGLCDLGNMCNSNSDCGSHYCNGSNYCAQPPTYSYYNNYNFEMGEPIFWNFSWTNGQNYNSKLTGQWSSEGNYSLFLAGANNEFGLPVWENAWTRAIHNNTLLEKGDEVCIAMKKNHSTLERWNLRLYTNGTFIDPIPTGEYGNLCTKSKSRGNLGIIAQGSLDECPDSSQCNAKLFIDDITINLENCTDGSLNRFETDVDCGGFCGKCSAGKSCLYGFDCESNLCSGGFCSGEEQEESLLEKYAPVLYFHPDEQFFPTTIDAMLGESDLKVNNITIDELPVSIDSLSVEDVTDEYYLDMRNASGGFSPLGIVPNQNRFIKYPYNVYGREFKSDPNFIALQYWFFYPYNNWDNRHEGDWEMIQIILNKSTEEPIISTYSIHLSGERHLWQDLLKNDAHSSVFVTIGGHGNWDTVGNHSHGINLFGIEICPFIDETSNEGNILSTNDYNIIQIDNKTSWVHYEGRWGEVEPSGVEGTLGVNSIINRQDGRMWNEPIEWGFNPDPSLFIACTGSPVNLNVFDSEGNQVGINEDGEMVTEIPNTYLYIPSDNDSELIAIPTSEDLTFFVTGTGQGKFNLTIGRNTKNLSSQFIIKYSDVEITNQTIAVVNITSTNPNFIMHIDEDGDGIIDTITNPDNITSEGNITNPEIDSDNDGYADSVDNCPNLSNPNQIIDFDGDGFNNLLCGGNDCDDSNVFIHPNAEEVCNSIDDNCNEQIDETDNDNDSFNDCSGEDLCLNSIQDNFPNLKKNHFAGNLDGCSCNDILVCKPGKNEGELKHGCTKGTIDNWLQKRGWAKSCG